MEGWIKLHRKIILSQYGKNLEMRGLFDSLVLMANHADAFTADGTLIKRGQLMTSILKLSEEFSQSETKMRRMVKKLKTAGQIDVQSSTKNSIITILNYDEYQGSDERIDERAADERRTSEEQAATNKNNNNNKNEKNINSIKRKPKTLEHSPLAFLFAANDEIQSWLLTGTEASQKELLEKHSHHVLAEEIKKAYLWQLEKRSRQAGSFLVTWMSNKNTSAFNPNQAQKSFSRGGLNHVTSLTPEEIQQAREMGII